MSAINIATENFWKFANTLQGSHHLEDAFSDWVNMQAIPVEVAREVWASLNIDIADILNKKAAITISGEPDELKAMFEGRGNISTEPKINAPTIENPIKKLPPAPPANMPNNAMGKPQAPGLPGGPKPGMPMEQPGGAEEPMLLDELASS